MRKIIPFLLIAQLALLTVVGISCANSNEEDAKDNSSVSSNGIYYVVENKSSSTLTLSVLGQPVIIKPNESFAIPMGNIFFIIQNKSYQYYLEDNISVDDIFLSILIR